MLCEALAGLPLWPGTLVCRAGAPLATGLAALVLLVALGLALAAPGPDRLRRLARAGLIGLAALALAVAAARPELDQTPPRIHRGVLVALIDGSESVWRDREIARAGLDRLAAGAEELLAGLPPEARAQWSGQVLRFGRHSEALSRPVPAAQLPAAIRAAAPERPAEASNGAAGLAAALGTIRDGGGRGAVLLLGDGHFAPRLPPELLAEAAAMGVAVHVLPIGALAPGAGLVAADLGTEQRLGDPAMLRLTLLGGGRLTVSTVSETVSADLPEAETLQPARIEAQFGNRGLRPLVARFETVAGVQERILYTLVKGPARLLVFGPGDWAAGLDPARFAVTRGDPRAPESLAGFDAVVIDGLAPSDFAAGFAPAMLAASDGTGLLLINGPQRGRIEDRQRISDWEATPLGPILPVSADPRFIIDQPPPRDVVLIIDISGSMSWDGGRRMQTARSVANLILDSVTPQDTVTIIQFHDAATVFGPHRASSATMAKARRIALSLAAQDRGTNVNVALDAADRIRTPHCAYFLISDADFYIPWRSPQCNAFAIGVSGTAYDRSLIPMDRQRILRAGQTAAGITFDFFTPEEREEFFLPVSYVPRAAPADAVLAPEIALDGLALTFPRPEADVVTLHATPGPTPVLAFRRTAERPAQVTAALLTALPARFATEPEGRAALDALFGRLVGWTELDRYDIALKHEDTGLSVRVTVLSDAHEVPPEVLSGSVIDGAGRVQPLSLRPDGPPGRFLGRLPISPEAAEQSGFLVLAEPGRPVQRIPMVLPQNAGAVMASADERFDSGVNRAEIDRLLGATGGTDLGQGPLPELSLPQTTISISRLDPWLIALALLSLAGAFWFGPHSRTEDA